MKKTILCALIRFVSACATMKERVNKENAEKKAVISKEISKLTRQLENAFDVLLDDDAAPQHLKDKVNRISSLLDAKQAEYNSIEETTYTGTNVDKYTELIKNLSAMPRKQKQIFVSSIIKKITVQPDGYFVAETTFGGLVGGATRIRIGE